jgi:protein-S-isoprenylcysteine O-methyltransferase Ste14
VGNISSNQAARIPGTFPNSIPCASRKRELGGGNAKTESGNGISYVRFVINDQNELSVSGRDGCRLFDIAAVFKRSKVMSNLNVKAWISLIFLTVVMGLLLFVCAGTVRYWQGWAYLVVFAGASCLTTIYLIKYDPALLKRRLRGGPTAEKERVQKIIMLFTSMGFIALLVVPALDYRFGWSAVPLYIVIAGDMLVATGFYFIFLVYKVNTFTSATIEIAVNQQVISTGPYALVRHPMYASALLYLLGTPLALGSYWGFLAFAATVPFLIWRLLDEEKFLATNLPGYTEYQQRVRSRLIPRIF